jgi:hypothetical protein
MTKKKFAIYQNGKKLFDYGIYIYDSIQINYMLQENKYEAGDTFKRWRVAGNGLTRRVGDRRLVNF